MTRQRTRIGRKNPIQGAPQAGWRINMARAGHVIAPRSVEYPESDTGSRITFVGVAFLLPDSEEVWVIPALGNSDREDNVLWHSMGTRRDSCDLTDYFTESLEHPKFGTVQSARMFTYQNVIKCDQPGCDDFGGWHCASRDMEFVGTHKAQVTHGSDYRVWLEWDWQYREWRLGLYVGLRRDTMNATVAASFVSDIAWLQSEAKQMNSREAVAA